LLLGAAWLVSAIGKEGVGEKGEHADNGEDLTREQQCFNAFTPVILASPRKGVNRSETSSRFRLRDEGGVISEMKPSVGQRRTSYTCFFCATDAFFVLC